jgi:acetoin utilization deacetylase AcuC-like enzyme
MLGNNPKVTLADVSCNSFDSWLPNSNRHFLEVISEGREYLDAVKRSLAHLTNVDALIYNAGMDPFEDDGMGGMSGITREVLAERERLVAQWCEDHQKPAMFVLAGGYCGSKLNIDGLVRMHLLTIKEFARIQIRIAATD